MKLHNYVYEVANLFMPFSFVKSYFNNIMTYHMSRFFLYMHVRM